MNLGREHGADQAVHLLDCHLRGQPIPVWSSRGERIIDLGSRDEPGTPRDRLADKPSGYPCPSQRSWWLRMNAPTGPSCGSGARISEPTITWRLISSNSSEAERGLLSHEPSGTHDHSDVVQKPGPPDAFHLFIAAAELCGDRSSQLGYPEAVTCEPRISRLDDADQRLQGGEVRSSTLARSRASSAPRLTISSLSRRPRCPFVDQLGPAAERPLKRQRPRWPDPRAWAGSRERRIGGSEPRR